MTEDNSPLLYRSAVTRLFISGSAVLNTCNSLGNSLGKAVHTVTECHNLKVTRMNYGGRIIRRPILCSAYEAMEGQICINVDLSPPLPSPDSHPWHGLIKSFVSFNLDAPNYCVTSKTAA
jgi:hypothetical protein